LQKTHSKVLRKKFEAQFKMPNSMDCVVKSISEMRPNFILSKSMNNIGCVHEIRNEYEQKELYVRCTQNYQQKFKAQFKLTRSIDHIVEMRS
jgi:hypothetical protein